MSFVLTEYLPIVIFLIIGFGMGISIVMGSMMIAPQKPYKEKLLPYECGFDMETSPRNKFHVKYYLMGILFIIFDIEIVFLYPWAVTLGELGKFGFWIMIIFLAILTIGYVYEWKKGALEWE